MKKYKLKVAVLTAVATGAICAATLSAGACWVFSLYEEKCPKSMLK